jgi:hypothetical protein
MFLTTVVHEPYQQHLQELSALSKTHSKQDHLEKVDICFRNAVYRVEYFHDHENSSSKC